MSEQLERFQEGRTTILNRAIKLLRRDRRIAAVWLHGSLGRGDSDGWSDIDLWIVVEDECMEALHAEREAFVAHIDMPLLCIEAPQNAPPGGVYLLAMYAGVNGPYILDCSWQPLSQARRPAGTVLVFERRPVPALEQFVDRDPDIRLSRATEQTRFFWMMATIVAKYIARHRGWEVLGLLSLLWQVVNEIGWLVNRRPSPTTYRDKPDFPPPLSPVEQMAALRKLISEVLDIMESAPALKEVISREVPEQVRLYLALVEHELG